MENAFCKSLTRFLLVLGVLGLLTSMVWAQAGTGELTGLVSDPSGAVVANATVTLINTATGDKRTTVTTPAGIYRFSALTIVGTYTLEVSPKGFKGSKVANIVISVGNTVTQDVKLELGAASEQVTVEAGVETVQTTESSVSQLIDRRIWAQMPLQVRNQNSFIELVAGAVPQDGTNNNRGAEVNGTRGGAGSYLVDGTDNNEQGQAGRGQISFYDKGGAATSISPDAIQEYRVITNSYSAEYGKGGGFITDTVLKSGTNSWHGSAFEYNRIQALAANDYFSDRAGIHDSLVRNQFGGSIGGPIVKDKTFFYGTAELHRVRQGSPLTATGTTQQFLDFVQTGGLQQFAETNPNGLCNNQAWWDANYPDPNSTTSSHVAAPCPGAFNLSATRGTIFNTLLANPAMNYPLSTNAGSFSQTGNGHYTAGLNYPVPVYGTVSVTDPTSQNEARWSVKFDHRFNDRDTFSAIYLFQDATYIDKYIGGNNVIGPAYIQDGRGQNLGLTWNHTLSPTLLNTFRVSYLRHTTNFPTPAGAFGIPAYYTNDGTGVDFGEGTGSPQFFTDNQFQYLDTMSLVRGKHSFKFGGEYRRTRNGSSFFNDTYGTVGQWDIEGTTTDMAFGDEAEQVAINAACPGCPATHVFGGGYYQTAAVNPQNNQAPDPYRGFRSNEFAAFIQDDWRVNNRLTVNLGLRWEYYGPPHNFKPGIDSNLYFGANVGTVLCGGVPCNTFNQFFPANVPFYAGVATEAFQTRNAEIWNKDTNNFGPRAGFAWDIFGTQKLVMRAGVGLMYDRIYNNTYENIRFNPPFYSDNQIGSPFNGVPVGPISSPGLFTYPFTSRALFNSPQFAPVPNPRHMDQNIVTPYYEQAHFGFQWEFAKGWVFEPEYVGTVGHKLTGLRDINTYNGRTAFGTSCASPTDVACRINPNIGADNFRSNSYGSNYHSLQMSVRKNYSNGLSFSGNYTYSKGLDTVSDLFNNGAAARPTDNQNIKNDYGPSDFDLRHRVVATVSYDLPFMKNNRFLGGWGTNSIISWQTGHPWTPFSNSGRNDLNKDGYATDRVVPLRNPGRTYISGSPADGTLDPALWGKDPTTGAITYYQCPASVNGGLWCDPPIGRNSVYGPHAALVDFNITKKFKVTESSALTFQANFFNLFNHPNFLGPTAGSRGSSNLRQPDFSASRSTWSFAGAEGGHRIVQMALRFDF